MGERFVPPCPSCDEAQRLLVIAEANALGRLRALRAANSRWKNARRDFLAVKAEKDTVVDQLTWLRARVDELLDTIGDLLDQVDDSAIGHPLCLTPLDVAALSAEVAAIIEGATDA